MEVLELADDIQPAKWHVEFLRYGFASALALLVDAGSLYLITEYLGVDYLLSAAIGFLLGMVTIYVLSIRWVFARRTLEDQHREIVLFVLIGLVGMAINEAGMYVFTEMAGFHYMVSKLFITGVVFLWNFGIRKWLLFR